MATGQTNGEGFKDALSGIVPLVQLAQGNEKLRVPLFRCIFLNGLILLVSVLLFEYLILPTIEALVSVVYDIIYAKESILAGQIGAVLWYMFAGLWVLPLFWISKPLNAFWFQDIANEAFKKRQLEHRNRNRSKQQSEVSPAYVLADILFSVTMDMLFMVQSVVVGVFPYVGTPLSLMHQILIISLYAFEYRCYSQGLANCKYRIAVIESNWPYFLGFGLPLTILIFLPNSYVVSTCLFALLFPVTLVSAYEARFINFTTANRSTAFKVPIFRLSAYLANVVTSSLLQCALGIKVSSTKQKDSKH